MSSAGAGDPARAARGRQHHPQWMPQKTKQQTPAAGGHVLRMGAGVTRVTRATRAGARVGDGVGAVAVRPSLHALPVALSGKRLPV